MKTTARKLNCLLAQVTYTNRLLTTRMEVFIHWVALHFARITLELDTPMTLSEMLSYLLSPTTLGS
jgi:hypothetical protein